MSMALGLGLGFFVFTSVAGVLAVGLLIGYQNTVDLLRQKAELVIISERNQIRQFLSTAQFQVEFISRKIADKEIEPAASEEFTSLLLGALAATPQIIRLQYVGNNFQMFGAERRGDETSPIFQVIKEDLDLRRLVEDGLARGRPHWGALLWRQEYGEAVLNYHHPVIIDGKIAGLVSALVSVRQISEFMSDFEVEFGANAFVLHGRDGVLAHPQLAFGYQGLSRSAPLPEVSRFSDPVLSSMWLERKGRILAERFISGPGVRFVSFGEQDYVILFRELEDYSDQPLLVGTYFQSHDLIAEASRLKWAVIICLAMSAVSALIAAYMGRKIAQPVRRLAEAAKQVHDLDLPNVQKIPGSYFRELNDAADAFNAMLDGLRWFERYVPKNLVRRLIQTHDEDTIQSTHRDLAIMFTDIDGFSAISERMDAQVVAELLNEHFTLIADCVEAEGGTIDKYIGDSVMAIWGAPDAYGDLEDRACRAALSIAEAVKNNNERKRRDGGERLTIRIGIHVGRVVVGNIGSPGRVNYTVIGDTVNVASRLEEAGKKIEGDIEVRILVSGAIRNGLSQSFEFKSFGTQQLRGREEPVEVSILVT